MVHQFTTIFHIICAISALISGLLVLLTRKGTRWHKLLGYAYFFNMLGLNVSALLIYELTGHFGPFHGAALASLLTLFAGFIAAFLRLPHGRWLEVHYEFMNWSYVGLVAAAVSETAVRIPSAPFWPAVVLGTLVVFVVGGILIGRGRGKYPFEALDSRDYPDAPAGIIAAYKRRRATCN